MNCYSLLPPNPLSTSQLTSQQDYMKAELKVLTAFVTFTFVMALAITNNSVSSRTYKEFEQELIDCFTCESTGVSPGKACSRSGFENVDKTPFLVAINEIALTIYPFVSLIYVVNITEIKKALLKCVNSRELRFRLKCYSRPCNLQKARQRRCKQDAKNPSNKV